MRRNYVAARLFMAASVRENAAEDPPNRDPLPTTWDKVSLIAEEVVVTFLIVFIPELLILGRPPKSVTEIWVSLLASLLRALYCYMRIRGIQRAKQG